MAGHAHAGYRQAPQHALQTGPAPVQVCGGCGFGAPQQGRSCAICASPLASSRVAAPPSGAIVWCAVRASFTCRSCAFHSPLDGIELEQGVHCAQCGAFQKFAAGSWAGLLAQCHAVADLGGPEPEGRFPHAQLWIGDINPHRELGVSSTTSEVRGDGSGGGVAPELSIGRGHPVCAACKQPLDVAIGGGKAETRCRGCAATAAYAPPPQVAHWAPALRAVVASQHRTDQRCVRLQQQAGGAVIALLCPGCGAPLRDVRTGSVRCAHCGTSAHVPARARPREGGGIIEADPFFMAFQGPSAERERLEQPTHPESATGLNMKGLLVRGLAPLAGIELPPKKGGLDLRQLGLTLALSALALAVGFVMVVLWNNVIG